MCVGTYEACVVTIHLKGDMAIPIVEFVLKPEFVGDSNLMLPLR